MLVCPLYVCLIACHLAGLLAVAMIPLIAVSAMIQMAMMTGGYGDNEASKNTRHTVDRQQLLIRASTGKI